MSLRVRLKSVSRPFLRAHARTPGIRRLPVQAVGIIVLLCLVNALVWAAVGIVFHYNDALTSTGILAYTLGLRHALDADHISAIDLMTRRLVAAGQRPATVGTYFSLGHSTIVMVTCIVVAATANAISHRFNSFSSIGGIIGTAVSAGVLILLGVLNIWILLRLITRMRQLLRTNPSDNGSKICQLPTGGATDEEKGNVDQVGEADKQCREALPDGGEAEAAVDEHGRQTQTLQREEGQARAEGWQRGRDDEHDPDQGQLQFHGTGCMMILLRGLLKMVDRPWKMYPLGVLFGLGFDTSSEVALIGIASIEGAKGTSIWLILVFPILFTAGMCLLDTIDGALMLSLYTSTSSARDPIAVTYYSTCLTIITIIVAVVIGTVQVLSLVLNVAAPTGPFWDGVQSVGDHFDVIGGCICASFVLLGGLSVVLYKPWRRRVDRNNTRAAVVKSSAVVTETVIESGTGEETAPVDTKPLSSTCAEPWRQPESNKSLLIIQEERTV